MVLGLSLGGGVGFVPSLEMIKGVRGVCRFSRRSLPVVFPSRSPEAVGGPAKSLSRPYAFPQNVRVIIRGRRYSPIASSPLRCTATA